MSFPTILKKKQNRLLSKTWRTALSAKEIERNNFHLTGDIHTARDFAISAVNYQPEPIGYEETTTEPTMIFSRAFI